MQDADTETNAFFNHFGNDKPTCVGHWLTRRFARRLFEFSGAGSESEVLEIGPGRGDFARICLNTVARYHAVEPNARLADALAQSGAEVTRAVVPPLPPVKGVFDVVVMVNVMEHMDSMNNALTLTRQIFDVLKPNGRFVVCSPDYLNWRHHFYDCDFSHNFVTTARRLEQLMLNAGFIHVRTRYVGALLGGWPCLLSTAFVSRLPFGALSAYVRRNRVFFKLYKMQLALLRKVWV
ncbi:MAG TPA: methyltransferase domain-containing protein, partial [Phycisphaerales bacterium]|nr:methyltransferase domain-containing protein [Phycisphaerales bacterium]